MAVTSTQAALTVTERQAPLPSSSDLVVDGTTEQYLYNAGVQGYLIGANDWGTRASYGTSTGYKVRVTQNPDDGSYLIEDYVSSTWKYLWATDGNTIYVDYASQGEDTKKFTINISGDKTFTIGHLSFEGTLLGATAGEDTRLYLKEAGTEGFSTVWYAVSVEDYEANQKAATVYTASKALWNLLVEADNLGMTGLADYEAVYANAETTTDEFAASVTALQEALTEYKITLATVANPVDLSSLVVNGTFDTVGDFTGWSGTAFGAGGTTAACAELYGQTYDTWQKIDNMANGVYALTVDAFDRAGSSTDAYTSYINGTEKNAFLYATNYNADGVAVDSVSSNILNIFDGILPNVNDVTTQATAEATGADGTYYVPNTMAAAVDYFNAGYYKNNKVLFAVSNGSAKIGVRKDKTFAGTDWSIFDNFGLTYYGSSAEAYQMWFSDFAKNLPSYDSDDTQVSTSCIDTYNNAKADALAATVSTYEEGAAKIAVLQAAQADIAANIAAWQVYMDQLAVARTLGSNEGYQGSEKDELVDYVDLDADEILAAKALSTEELEAEIAKLKAMCENVIQNAIVPGTDLTELLKNPDFSAGKDGWTFQAVSGGNVDASASAKCAEAWDNADFDIYQIIEGAPAGAYKISVQGFYRRGRGDAAWQYYFDSATGEKKDNVEAAPAYVYLNEAKTPLMSVFEYAVPEADNYYTETGTNAAFLDQFGYYFPNSMTDAGLAFDHGAYSIEAIGLVANKGDQMRIGMKGNTTQEGDSWAIFTRFKLTYMGFDAELLKEPLETAIADIRAKLDAELGTDVKAQAEALAKAGEDALAAMDGKVMNTALSAIYAYSESVDESIALFAALTVSLDDLENTLAESEASDEVKTKVAETIDNIRNSVSSYTNADVETANATIAECRYQLSLPAGYDQASDANPVDLTSLMQTPSFEKDGSNSLDGWEGTTGYNYGNDATQKAALALEFYDKNFDMYQDIIVPNGTYNVSVNAFNRAGSITADYSAYVAGTASKAVLYAQSGETEITKPIEHIANVNEAASDQLGLGSESSFTTSDGLTYYAPNDMVSSVAYFSQGRYINGVTIKVTDGKLRVGIRQADKVSGSWVIMDDFKLMYLGTDSSAEEQGWNAIEDVETAAEVKSVEIYSVDGIKQNSLQNGINVVVIKDAEGKVTTKTVIK